MDYANSILSEVLILEELAEIDKANDRADIACEIAEYGERKGSGYYD